VTGVQTCALPIYRLRITVPPNDEDVDDNDQPIEPVDETQQRLYADWTATPYTKQSLHKLRDKVNQ